MTDNPIGPDKGDPGPPDAPSSPKEKPDAAPRNAEQGTRAPAFADYLRVFTYATKWDFVAYAVASVSSIGAGVALPLMIVIFGQLVGEFSQYAGDPEAMTRESFRAVLDRQALFMMGLFLGRWALNTINKFCFRMIGLRLSSAVRMHYLRTLFAQSIHVIDSMPAGAPAAAITATSNTLQVGVSERLGTFLEYNGTIWSALIVAFIWSWDLTLVISSLIIYSLVVLSVVVPFIVKKQTAMVMADMQGTAVASEALGGIRLVMACGAQEHVLQKYSTWVLEAKGHGLRMAPVVGAQMGLLVSCPRTVEVDILLLTCPVSLLEPSASSGWHFGMARSGSLPGRSGTPAW